MEQNQNRRHFLKAATVGAAALTTGAVTGSVSAAETGAELQSQGSNIPSEKKLDLLFLGTGAANWPKQYPPLKQKLPRGQVRGMSSILVNGRILIDCGPTVLDVMQRYEVNPVEITDILLTHTHSDHLHEESILKIANSRASGMEPLRFWGDPEALKKVPDSDRIEKNSVEIGQGFQIHGLVLTGLASNHQVAGSKEQCLIYLIEGATRAALYATDGAWLLTSTWNYLRKKRLDAIIWDATCGEGEGDPRIFSHNDLSMIRHMNASLLKGKILKPDAQILLTHIARKLHPAHSVLEKKLLPEGLIPAYDGMSVVLS